MRRAPTLLLLLSALACNEGKIELEIDEEGLSAGEEGAGSGASEGSEGSGGGNTTDPDDGGGEDPDDGGDPDDASPWAGAYTGEQSLGATAPNGEWRDLCWGEAAWEITDAGDLIGRGECVIDRGPQRGEYFTFDYAGESRGDGMVAGQVVLARSWADAVDELEFEAWVSSEGGDQWLEAWMVGTIETRDGEAQVEGWAWGGSW
jgi:hypothetical protein